MTKRKKEIEEGVHWLFRRVARVRRCKKSSDEQDIDVSLQSAENCSWRTTDWEGRHQTVQISSRLESKK